MDHNSSDCEEVQDNESKESARGGSTRNWATLILNPKIM